MGSEARRRYALRLNVLGSDGSSKLCVEVKGRQRSRYHRVGSLPKEVSVDRIAIVQIGRTSEDWTARADCQIPNPLA
jgi:hypothetical protein